MTRAALRALLLLYPAAVRRDYGPAMLETLEARLQAEPTAAGRRRAVLREAAGLIAGALSARLSRRRSTAARSSPIPTPRDPVNGILHGLAQDLRYALRTAVRDPGYSLVVILTLALGIGANSAVFSVVHGVLLEPLPYADSERLVRIESGWGTMSKAMQVRLRRQMRSLEDVAGYSGWSYTVGGEDSPEVVRGALVSSNYFDLLGVRPAIGRAFVAADAEPGNDDVVILGHELWQRRFGGDPDVVGRRVPIDNEQHTTRVVIGVMPAGYRSLDDWALWTPYAVDPTDDRDFYHSWYLQLVGRLAPGSDTAAATRELLDVMGRLETEEDAYGLNGFDGVEESAVASLLESKVGQVRSTLLVLLGAVGLVLLIACVNVANLQLARSAVRRRELAVRTALGARRGRLVRQLATESMVLAVAGAAVGVAGAAALLGAVRQVLPRFVPRAESVGIDATVLAATALVAVLAGLAFGTVPAWLHLRGRDGTTSAARGARDAGGGVEEGKASRALVVAEVALACVIVVGAGLMVRTLAGLWSVPPGFEAEGVVTMRATAPSSRYEDRDAQRAFWAQALERVAAVPGVERAGAIHLLPLALGNWSFPFLAEGHVAVENEPLPTANFRIVSPGYFETMGVELVEGRTFDSRDGADGQPAVILNRRLADELWPEGSAIGKEMKLFGNQPMTVVGVVGDVRQFSLETEPVWEMYRPVSQWPIGSMVLVVRSSRPASVVAGVREALRQLDPAAPVFDVATMDEVMAESLASTRFAVALLSGFAALALLLGAVGVYGVMSYVVSGRTREIGIRMALGARAGRVQGAVIRAAMWPVAGGILLGLAVALAGLRLMSSLLYGVAPSDPTTYAAVAAILVVTGVLAAWLPARRAARVDPLRALELE